MCTYSNIAIAFALFKCMLILVGSGVKLDKKVKLNYYRKVKSES